MKTNLSGMYKDRRGVVMVTFFLFVTVLLTLLAAASSMSINDYRASERAMNSLKAFYLAEAAVDKKLAEVNAGNTGNISSTSLGDGTYSATYVVSGSQKTITGTGVVGGITRQISATLSTSVSFTSQAAAFVDGGVASTSGGINIDGRDHDTDGNLTGGAGTYGVATSGTFSQGGSSEIGGNGIAPARPADPATIQEGVAGYGTQDPEQILGVPAGTLDVYKMTRAEFLAAPTPLNGIYYIYDNSDVQLNAYDFGDSDDPGQGIIICHNAANSCEIKNMHGYFTGLVVTDKFEKINGSAELRGSLIVTNPSGATIGNGSAEIKYSSTAIGNALTTYTTAFSGDYTVESWQDTTNV